MFILEPFLVTDGLSFLTSDGLEFGLFTIMMMMTTGRLSPPVSRSSC